ncbi:hypothetical protein R75461_08072 [Paraburkholderia nemoris]|uniref:hypothetical protein n=1 Tax=Paraburkholderia nemoris TaxID=2793076 RepID=UPI00190DFC66|nr:MULTISPECIES: hypothetical protein [Paraburkholderia]MBK3786856.1 hypothetical protein [Paraburkholderia aspalathi]CAE6862680.1 hypothetical protein R75461_08072 [Paraburkholderia nemoris]
MITQTKHGHVVFEHDDAFHGEVRIVKGELSVTVSIDALRALVAESVRYDLAARVARMKPADLLRRIA